MNEMAFPVQVEPKGGKKNGPYSRNPRYPKEFSEWLVLRHPGLPKLSTVLQNEQE